TARGRSCRRTVPGREGCSPAGRWWRRPAARRGWRSRCSLQKFLCLSEGGPGRHSDLGDGVDVAGPVGPVVVGGAVGVDAERFLVAGAADVLVLVLQLADGHQVGGLLRLDDEEEARTLGCESGGLDAVDVEGALLVVAVVLDGLAEAVWAGVSGGLHVDDEGHVGADDQPVRAGAEPHAGAGVSPVDRPFGEAVARLEQLTGQTVLADGVGHGLDLLALVGEERYGATGAYRVAFLAGGLGAPVVPLGDDDLFALPEDQLVRGVPEVELALGRLGVVAVVLEL